MAETTLTANQTADGDGSAGTVTLASGTHTLYSSGVFTGKETLKLLGRPNGSSLDFNLLFEISAINPRQAINFQVLGSTDVKFNMINSQATTDIDIAVG